MLKHWLLVVIALMLLVRAVTHAKKAEANYSAQDIPIVEAELAQRMTPGSVAARKPNIVWSLNLHHEHYPAFEFIPLPNQNIPGLLEELRRRKIDYLYLGAAEWHMRPELRPLWFPQNVPPDLKLIYYRPTIGVAVYQLQRPEG